MTDYTQRLSAVMDIEVPTTIVARPLRKSQVQFARFTSRRHDHRDVVTPVEDAFLVVLPLIDNPPRQIFYDGRHILRPEMKQGHFTLIDESVESIIDMEMYFDNVHMHFSAATFKDFVVESGLGQFGPLHMEYGTSVDDIVVRSLGQCLLPAFQHPERAHRLFVDHVATALLTHIAGAYGSAKVPALVRGGLAPWQERRAKEILISRLDGEIGMEDLARECGLSRSHFARAFKKTTGVPPHRWLMERRLERARELLLKSKLSLADIAGACGFADQSHFTRSFFTAMGVVPSEWRRLRSG